MFILLGDIGGFNGAIMILPAYLMSLYTDRMFRKSIAAETPIRKPINKNKPQPALSESVLKGDDPVSQVNVTSMLTQVKLY